ncbi:MAG: hypothetical protein GX640_10440 [Fibrobacter sp.]|nr:hypothetical protein [Fibrobacter sp.]
MDSKVIFDMVEQGNNLFNDKSNLDASEVINFYSTSQKANLLRRYSCRFLSEWAMNLDVAIPRMKGRFTTIGLKGRLSPYIWWSDAVSKGVDLPANRHVWHYNPVAFIEALHALSNISNPGITPVQNAAVCSSADVKFYIVRPTGEQEASGHGDLSDEDISCKREIMVCEKNNGTEKKWKIGIAATLQNCRGLGFTGNTRLKKALIDGGVEGIPEITERRKRIWASIWWSEGCLEAINQYDSAFLSFGPIQQTIGTGGGKGELSAALAYVKNENPEIFNKYFGQYGLDAVEVSKAAYGVEYAYLKLNGILVNKTDLKNEFRKFIWGYRCVKAMNDPVFRKLFLAYGFKRIELVENMQKTIGSTTVVFKDVFKSELAHALALDAHINLPAKVDSSSGDGIWVKALKAVKGTASGGVDISTITQNDEYEMIKKLLFYRQKCGMWSPCARAAMIILCCKDLSDTLVKSLGYSGLYELYTDADLTSSKAQKYKYNFLQTTRESYV